MNSSVETSACRKTPASVPIFTSLCIGTTQPLDSPRMMTWLPDWRTLTKPRRSRALTIAVPEVRGSLGMCGKAEHCDYWMPWSGKRKLGQIECRRLFQIGDCLFNRFTLRGSTRFGIERDISAFFGGRKNSGQFHNNTSKENASIVLYSTHCRQLLHEPLRVSR